MIKDRMLVEYGVLIYTLLPMSRIVFGCAEQEIIKVSVRVYDGATHDE